MKIENPDRAATIYVVATAETATHNGYLKKKKAANT